jgi:hypothetical protein
MSIFGILYLIVAIGIIWKAGGLGGGLSLLCMAIVGAFLVGMSGPGEMPDYLPTGDSPLAIHVLCRDDNDNQYGGDLVHTVRAEEKWRFDVKSNTFSSSDRDYVSPSPKIYQMHNPDGGCYVRSWIFHPASFFWSPFIMAVLGVVGWICCLGIRRN